MKGKKLLTLTLAALFALGVFAGCAKNDTDIVGKVGETPIYRWYYNAQLQNQLTLYKKNTGVDLTDDKYSAQYKEYKVNQLNNLVGFVALKEEARKEGLYNLTVEQEAEIDARYLSAYNSALAVYTEQYGSDEQGRRKAEQAYTDLLKGSSLTPDRVRENIKDEYVVALLVDKLGKSVSVTDERIREYYDDQLADQQKNEAADPAWFAKNTPAVVIARPAGYVQTSRLMLKFTVAHQTKIKDAQTSLATAQQAYEQAKGSLMESVKKDALDRAQANFNNVVAACYQELDERLLKLRDEAGQGTDFITLVNKNSEDTSLIPYYVGKDSGNVEQAYADAALALENVGDISDPVHLSEGSCIVCLQEKFTGDVLPLDEVRDDIKSVLTFSDNTSMNFSLMEEYAKKAQDAGIVTLYPDKL